MSGRTSVAAVKPGRIVSDWFFAAAPPQRLAVLRVLVGAYAVVYLVVRADYLVDLTRLPDSRFEPVGFLAALDTAPPDALVLVALGAAMAGAVAFCVGWRFEVSGPIFAAALLFLTTFGNSWGQVFHTEHLIVLHVAVLAVAPSAAVFSADSRRRGLPPPESDPRFGWPATLMATTTVTAYFLAGWAKLENSGLAWATGDILRNHVAHDNLRKILLEDPNTPIGEWAVGHGWLFAPMAVTTLVVELGAPLALLGGRVARWWAAAAWTFHVGVLALMAIFFPYPLVGIAFAPLFAVERLPGRLRGVLTRPVRAAPDSCGQRSPAPTTTSACPTSRR